MIEKSIGMMYAEMNGSGLYSKAKVKIPVMLVAAISEDPEDIEYDSDGKVEYLYGYFTAKFCYPLQLYCGYGDQEAFSIAERFMHPYTDKGFVESINTYIDALGYPGKVDWSELGRQSYDFCDFDADYAIFRHLFPEVFHGGR